MKKKWSRRGCRCHAAENGERVVRDLTKRMQRIVAKATDRVVEKLDDQSEDLELIAGWIAAQQKRKDMG